MNTIYIVCEGQSEEAFIKQVLAPYFQSSNLQIIPIITKTSANHQGGGLKYSRIKKEILVLLDEQVFVSTFFDYYALPKGFPLYDEQSGDIYQKIDILEQGFNKDINNERFFSHIQPHEFEALLFSDIDKIIEANPSWNASHLNQLQRIMQEFANIKLINNSPQTSPSHRLKNIFPDYQKITHGTIIAKKTTIPTIRAKCRHFDEWCNQLECFFKAD